MPTNINENYLVIKVENQAQYEELWRNWYTTVEDFPDSNIDTKDIYFLSLFESSSCPSKLNDVQVKKNSNSMIVFLSKRDSPCDSDAVPRSFVLEIDKKISVQISEVVLK